MNNQPTYLSLFMKYKKEKRKKKKEKNKTLFI